MIDFLISNRLVNVQNVKKVLAVSLGGLHNNKQVISKHDMMLLKPMLRNEGSDESAIRGMIEKRREKLGGNIKQVGTEGIPLPQALVVMKGLALKPIDITVNVGRGNTAYDSINEGLREVHLIENLGPRNSIKSFFHIQLKKLEGNFVLSRKD